jgi:tetratricopeptide (TPR) repeat protein
VAVGLSRRWAVVERAAPVLGAALGLLGVAPHARAGVHVGLDRTELPLEAIQFATENGLRERMYNDFEVGAYLLWEGYPRHRVFVDPRLPAYPLSFHRLLGQPRLDRTQWDEAMASFGVESALVAYAGINHRVSWWDPRRWALVYRAHDARVFVRRLPRWRALIAAREIPATFGFTVAEGATTVPLEEPPPESPVTACEWQRRLGELLFELGSAERAMAAYERALEMRGCLEQAKEREAAAWVGAVRMNRGDQAGALPFLERAGDEDLPSLTNRALALEALGRWSEAKAAWGLIAERAHGTPLGERAAGRR